MKGYAVSASTARPLTAASARTVVAGRTRRHRRPSNRRNRSLLAPAVLMELLIHILPMLVGIWTAVPCQWVPGSHATSQPRTVTLR